MLQFNVNKCTEKLFLSQSAQYTTNDILTSRAADSLILAENGNFHFETIDFPRK